MGNDNYLCTLKSGKLRDPVFPKDFKWSAKGIPRSYRCTRVIPSCGNRRGRCSGKWKDNYISWKQTYLCVPPSSSLSFSWISNGDTKGKTCIQWKESHHSWGDNYLCLK